MILRMEKSCLYVNARLSELILELGKPCDCKAVGCMLSSIIQVIHLLILLDAYNVSTFSIDRRCCAG